MDGEVGGEEGQTLDGTQAQGVRGGDKGSEVNPGSTKKQMLWRTEMKQRRWRLRVYAFKRQMLLQRRHIQFEDFPVHKCC